MDDIIFYQPPSASRSQPRLPGARASSNASGASIVSLSVRQTVSQLNPQNEISKDQRVTSRDVSDLSQKRHSSDQRRRNDNIHDQENLTATRNSANSDDDDDFPDIDELLSGIMQKKSPASADPNSDDDDGFIDIDDFLSDIQRKSIPASANPNSGGMAEKVDNGTRGDSPVGSGRSTVGSTQDPIILSEDESVGVESETDYGDLDVDLRAKSGSDPPHVADSGLADDNDFASGTGLTSDRLATDHQDDSDNRNNGVVDNTHLWPSNKRPRSASPGHGSVAYQASKIQANTDFTQGSTNYVDLGVTTELEDEGSDVFAEGNDEHDDDTRSTNRSKLSAVSSKNPTSDSNVPELQDSQPDYIQSPHLGSAAAFLHQPDLKNDHLPKHLRRRRVTRNIRRERPRSTAPIGLTGAASLVSAALESTDLEEAQSHAVITAPDQEREIRDMDQEMADDGSTDSSRDQAQPLQLDEAAFHQQSDPTSESLPAAHRARKSPPRHVRHKHPLSPSSIRLATAVTTASTVLKSTNLEIRQSRPSATDPSHERQLCDIDDASADDLSDEDYVNYSHASSNAVERPPPSKRLRQAEDLSVTTYHDPEKDSDYSFELSNQDRGAAPSTTTPQSEEIPIRGFLTLKTFESKVIYCFSFSQELSLQSGRSYASRSGDRGDSEQSPLQEQTASRPIKHSKFSPEEDKLLRRLKEEECLSWDEIAEQFPRRSKGTLQVRYSTKLKRRSGTTKNAKKRRRSE